jgi:hypothetical protein
MRRSATALLLATLLLAGCADSRGSADDDTAAADTSGRLDKYTTVRLTTDMTQLSERERTLVGLLIDAASYMDELFWQQAYGDRNALLSRVTDEATRQYVMINYGPWDRLEDNAPFIDGVGPKPEGSNLYPADMTKEEFERVAAGPSGAQLRSLYTVVRRDSAGGLQAVPYSEAYRPLIDSAAAKLRTAATYADEPMLKKYLELRAAALLSNDYFASDLAWLDMKQNGIDVIIGPIETYEDALFGYKAAFEGLVLVKDRAWSERLTRYATMLPALQQGLPVEGRYRSETPGSESELNAYDVVFYAGDANAGSKSIAVNLPNDEQVQLQKGTRRLQLKNAMQAKFDRILVPIANVLIAEDQRRHITFDAFFSNVMFHEVAHGLGIKNTVNGRGTVRESLKEHASPLEEGKADVLGLYMVTKLHEQGQLGTASLEDCYVTFLASIFRSVRFGAASAHGRANMARFNYFAERGAFARDPQSGTYRVDMTKMRDAMNALSSHILTLQGNGDYDGVSGFLATYGVVPPELQGDLERVNAAGIPVDIVFEQGRSVLGLPAPGPATR